MEKEQIINYLKQTPHVKHTLCEMKRFFKIDKLNKILLEMKKEHLIFQNAKKEFLTIEQAGMIVGKLSINRSGMGFIDDEKKGSYKIDQKDLQTAMNGDIVVIQRLKKSFWAKVIAIKQRALDKLVGTIDTSNIKHIFIPDDDRLKAHNIYFSYPKDFMPIDGLKVLVHITRYGKPLFVNLVKVIGHKDDPGVDISSILASYNIPLTFPEDVMQDIKKLAKKVYKKQLNGRKDLRQMPFITIDGDHSKDFDDALTVKKRKNGYHLWVAIADVSTYVKAGSALDKEAQKRSFSTYVIDRVVPMLPHELSNGLASLNPHQDRLTITCEMFINKQGNIVDYEIYPAVINSFARMTYNVVNQILKGDKKKKKEHHSLVKLLQNLWACSLVIRHNREQKGAIEFSTLESEVEVDEKGKAIAIYPRQRDIAEKMVEDCMIAANVSVANYMSKHNIPCIYRIHEKPGMEKMNCFKQVATTLGETFNYVKNDIKPKDIQKFLSSIKDDKEVMLLNNLLLRSMQKAKYDIENKGHFGLAEDNYLHFTSPIRRYPDLIVHRMLWKYVFQGKKRKMKIDIDQNKIFAQHASVQERICTDAEYACLDMKKAEYMGQCIGQKMVGIITNITSFGMFVQLKNTIEGLISLQNMPDDYYQFDEKRMELVGQKRHSVYRVGKEIMIEVIAGNKQRGTVDFALVSNKV